MTEQQIEAVLLETLQRFADDPSVVARATYDSRLKEDLNLSSLHFVDILLDIEERFDFLTETSEVNDLSTVGEWVAFVKRKRAECHPDEPPSAS